MHSVMRLSIIIMITGAVPFDSVAAEETLLSQSASPAASSLVPIPTIAPSVAEIRQSVAIYTYWTTGWAVLGLLKTMPE